MAEKLELEHITKETSVQPAHPLETSESEAQASEPLFRRALNTIWGWRELAFRRSHAAPPFRPDLPEPDLGRLEALMQAYLEGAGGAPSARAKAAELGTVYLGLDRTGQRRFFRLLTERFDLCAEEVEKAARRFLEARERESENSSATYIALQEATLPPRVRLLKGLNALPDGFNFLVDLRADLLSLLDEEPSFERLDYDLRALFDTWFDVGLLTFEVIGWDSPASLLERLVDYEAVHEIRSWTDLKNRLDADRRCYAFFHPKIPREPLIFVEVALIKGIPGSVQELLDETAPLLEPERADTAVFYSISNTKRGLRGISFGSFLLKRVMSDLSKGLPNLQTFVTLSPIPGFRHWLLRALESQGELLFGENERREVAEAAKGAGLPTDLPELLNSDWHEHEEVSEALREPLLALCAAYLLYARKGDKPHDPVARFHLVNGARVERVHFGADLSPKGLRESFGLMINYRYEPDRLEENHERLFSRSEVVAAPAVKRLAKEARSLVEKGATLTEVGS